MFGNTGWHVELNGIHIILKTSDFQITKVLLPMVTKQTYAYVFPFMFWKGK